LLYNQHDEAASDQEQVRKQEDDVPIVEDSNLLPERQVIPFL
jgi:hypothetical protein